MPIDEVNRLFEIARREDRAAGSRDNENLLSWLVRVPHLFGMSISRLTNNISGLYRFTLTIL
jgi:hypothetical protein